MTTRTMTGMEVNGRSTVSVSVSFIASSSTVLSTWLHAFVRNGGKVVLSLNHSRGYSLNEERYKYYDCCRFRNSSIDHCYVSLSSSQCRCDRVNFTSYAGRCSTVTKSTNGRNNSYVVGCDARHEGCRVYGWAVSLYSNKEARSCSFLMLPLSYAGSCRTTGGCGGFASVS